MFPKAEALRIAMDEISNFLMREDVDMTVKLVVFDDKAFRLSRNLFFQVESFINDDEVIAAHKEEYGLPDREFERERARFRREREEVDYYASFSLCENSIPMEPVELETPHGKTRKTTGSKPFNESTFDKNLYMSDGKEELSFQQHLLKLMTSLRHWKRCVQDMSMLKLASIPCPRLLEASSMARTMRML